MSLIYLPSIQGLDAVSFLTLAAVGAVPNANGASISADQVLTLQPANGSFPGVLTAADWTTFNNKQAAGNYITALTGDGTAAGPGSAALTLATVNSNVGSFGSSTSIPSFTVDAKGRITAASGNAVIAPAGTLTGTTLASNVVTSSLTTLGTVGTGVWQGTAVAIGFGGTGQATKAAGFDALSPMTTSGDIIYGGASGTGTRLAKGSDGQYLKLVSGLPAWAALAAASWAYNTYTTTQVLTTANNLVSVSGDNYTVTLPSATTAGAGFFLAIHKSDGLGANGITISRAGSDTIGDSGATSVKLQTLGETYVLYSDGSSKWQIFDHQCDTPWVAFTPTGAYNSNTTYTGSWRRVGDSVEVIWHIAFTGTPNSPNPTTVNLPSNIAIDTTKLLTSTAGTGNMGTVVGASGGGTPFGMAVYNSTTAIALRAHSSAQTNLVDWTGTSPVSFGNGDTIDVRSLPMPVANWTA